MGALQRKHGSCRSNHSLEPARLGVQALTRVLPIIAILLAVGCSGKNSTSSGNSQVILRMHGSNTIGAQLAPALAEAFLRTQGATEVKRIPSRPEEVVVQGVFPDSSIKSIEIAAHGSATAFSDLKGDKCDIGNASRQIKPDEVTGLSALGDMLSPASEHVLGLDGIAIIVNVSNSVQSISKGQLQQVFGGKLTDWAEVGRPLAGPITVARDEKSGTWDTFKALVLGNSPLTPAAKRFEDSRELSDRVADDPNGIGFIGLPYVRSAKAIAVSDSGTRAIFPTRLTIATEDYPLSRRLYLYTAANPQDGATRDFVNFALSKAGQEIVSLNGFVGQTAEPPDQPTPPPNDAPSDYKRLTAGAERLPLDFRFGGGSIALDNKALYDLGRVVDFVGGPQYKGQKILLLGFADASGSREKNCELSKERARIVADAFSIRGITASAVTGFCSDLAVASNATAEGREKTGGLKFGWADDLSLKMADGNKERGLRSRITGMRAATAAMPWFSAQEIPMRSDVAA